MRKIISSIIVAAVFLAGTACTTDTGKEPQLNKKPEYMLVSLDRGNWVSADDPDLPKVKYYVDELSKIYQMAPGQIADISWSAEEDLRAAGITDEPVLIFLSKIHKTSLGKDPTALRGSYDAVVSLYVASKINKK